MRGEVLDLKNSLDELLDEKSIEDKNKIKQLSKLSKNLNSLLSGALSEKSLKFYDRYGESAATR